MKRLDRVAVLLLAVMIAGCAAGAGSGAKTPDRAVPVATEKELFDAVEQGRIKAVRATLAAHPEWIESHEHRWDVVPLHIAVWDEHEDITVMLLDLGADVNATSRYGWRPLHEAAERGNLKMITLLADRGAQLEVRNSDGLTPMLMAANQGNMEAVKLLLARGASPNERDKSGGTLLHCAAAAGNADMVRFALAAQADQVRAADKDGRTPLHVAVTPEVAVLLLDAGADPNAADHLGSTPLHLAAMFGQAPLADTLIARKADLTASTKLGRTPLHIAAAEGQTAIIEILSAAGADPNARDMLGQTPLHAVAYSCPLGPIAALVKAKADPNARDKQGLRPADVAGRWGNVEAATVLGGAAVQPAGQGVVNGSASGLTETRVGPRGQFYVDGQPRILFGVWQQATYLMEYHRYLGINLMVCPPGGGLTDELEQRPYAARAAAVGLGAVLHQNPDVVDSPAVWGWFGGGWPHSQSRIKLEEARCQSTQRAVFCNFGAHDIVRGEEGEFFLEALRNIDVIVPHVWPEMFHGEPRNLRNIALMIDQIRTWCKDRPRGEVSIWADINCHEWFEQDRKGGDKYEAPTIEEFKFQIWLALVHGADGFCIFPISFDPFVYAQIPAQFEERMPAIFAEVQRFEKVLCAAESPRSITVTGSDAEGIVDFTARRHDGADYVFVVNGTARPQTIRCAADGLGSDLALTDALADKPLDAAGGAYEEKLDGLAYRVWRIAPR